MYMLMGQTQGNDYKDIRTYRDPRNQEMIVRINKRKRENQALYLRYQQNSTGHDSTPNYVP